MPLQATRERIGSTREPTAARHPAEVVPASSSRPSVRDFRSRVRGGGCVAKWRARESAATWRDRSRIGCHLARAPVAELEPGDGRARHVPSLARPANVGRRAPARRRLTLGVAVRVAARRAIRGAAQSGCSSRARGAIAPRPRARSGRSYKRGWRQPRIFCRRRWSAGSSWPCARSRAACDERLRAAEASSARRCAVRPSFC